MNLRTTAVLALLVAALGAFIWFQEIRGAERRAEAESAAKRVLPGLAEADVRALELRTRDGETARLERAEAGTWWLRQPVDFPADAAAVEGVLSTLVGLESEAVYEDPAPLEDYGLTGEPRLRIESGTGEQVLRVGDASPLGDNSYLAVEGDPKVYAVPTWRTRALERDLGDLRDKQLLAFDRDAARALAVRWPGAQVRLVREEGADLWRLVEPLAASADERTVRDLLADLAFLRASGFVDDPAPSDQEALASPALAVEITLASEEGTPARRVELAIADATESGERLARGRAEHALYRLPAERLDDFPRRLGAYRFRTLASFDAGAAERFELAFQDPQALESVLIEGVRGEAGWETRPEPMDPAQAAVLVAELASLRAEEAEDAPPAERLAVLGLEPPHVHVRVFGEGEGDGDGDALLADLRLGVADSERGIAAQRADRDGLFWISYDAAAQLPISLEAFRNRFLEDAGEPDEAEDEGAAVDAEPGAPAGEAAGD